MLADDGEAEVCSRHTSKNRRADERTQTTGLLITSDNKGVAARCRRLQKPYIKAVFCYLTCRELQDVALSVVSKWCQLMSELSALVTLFRHLREVALLTHRLYIL